MMVTVYLRVGLVKNRMLLALGIFQNGSLFPPPSEGMMGFFSDLYHKNHVELVEANFIK